MRILLLTLITHLPDPVTGTVEPTHDRLRRVIETGVAAEELGYDGFAVGERHERPFISSAPPVVLSHLAARTSRIRLFTGVTTLSLLDPVRAYEDYATLDQLSSGRLELMIGKGNGTAQRELFSITEEDQWERNRESYELFRTLWQRANEPTGQQNVTWSGRFRPPLHDAEVWPLPYQPQLRVWHGSATSRASVDLAVEYGEPLFSANVTYGIEPYRELIDYYRRSWAEAGRNPADALVGAGTAGFLVQPTSQAALNLFRPVFDARSAAARAAGLPSPWRDYTDFLENSSALVGSPSQVIEKVHRYHEAFGHDVMHLSADGEGLTPGQHRTMLELFQNDVAPELRRLFPSRPLKPLGTTSTTPTTPSEAHHVSAV
ncbi:LLM class flavin-dependent oxidoreductase [Citricoccus sp. NR2]|uniref:LLM class flavin-dependent oxidoreductase n=1 Tax=Citricoccus sp. NR2 TaxID=3004095 RepID=UPI0022DDE4A6|nr:LLM class flavin-dependent oxidoreductase [Citricoccus sp. NR2]WBL19532.1 LLM class flavin-dependent oxidoreductase [Citricoccus sp. NR2]